MYYRDSCNRSVIFIIVFYYYCGLVQCQPRMKAQLNPTGPTVTKDATKCLNKLAKNNFLIKGGILMITKVFNMTSQAAVIESQFIADAHANSQWSILIVSLKRHKISNRKLTDDEILKANVTIKVIPHLPDDLTSFYRATYYVIIVDNYENYKNLLEELSILKSWNPKASFLVYCFRFFGSEEIRKRFAGLIIHYSWMMNVFNIAVLLPHLLDRRRITKFTWNPYEPPNYCGYKYEIPYNRVKVDDVCQNGEIIKNYPNTIFDNKLPTNMDGCLLRVISVVMPPFMNIDKDANGSGIEFGLIQLIAENEKFKIKLISWNGTQGTARGNKINGTWTEGLSLLQLGVGDILVGGLYPDNEVHDDFEASNSYLQDSYTWVVARAQKLPPWVSLIIIFHFYTWMSVVGGYFLSIIVWKAFGIVSDESIYHKTNMHCALNAWYMTVGGSAYMRPVKHTLRLFFIFFTLYCVVLDTGYQTKLIDVLTIPQYQNQLDTIEKLLDSSLKWGGLEELSDIFENSSDSLDQRISSRYINIMNIDAALNDVIQYRNFSLLTSRALLNEHSASRRELSDVSGESTYVAFESNVLSIPLEIIAMKGYPFLKRFNNMIQLFKSNGLMKKLTDDFKERVLLGRAGLKREASAEEEDTPLSLDHLQGGFFIIVSGYIVGFLVFLIELFINTLWYINKRQELASFYKATFY